MKDENTIRSMTGNAVRSLYQMIMLVNEETFKCHVIDYNRELRSVSEAVSSFDEFCDDLYENIHPEDREGFKRFINPDYFPKELVDKVYTSYECRIRQVNSRYYWSEVTFCNATVEDSTVGHEYLFLIRDIDECKRKKLQEDMEQRRIFNELQEKYSRLFEENMKDEQTGCYNRKGMNYYTDIVLDEAERMGRYIFACVVDLNGLKYLNDTFGHAVGDEAIAVVSSILRDAAPGNVRIVRTGGDEFLMIGSLEQDSSEPHKMSEKIEEELDSYNRTHSNAFTVGASYGWVLQPWEEGMADIDKYIEIADARMYEMKKRRDNHRRS